MFKKLFNIYFVAVLLVILNGCNGSSSGSSTEPPAEPSWVLTYISIPDSGVITDSEDPAIEPFVDLKKVKFDIDDRFIRVEINVRKLPPTLPYNEYELNNVEYRWAVYFDMDDDSQNSVGDLALDLDYHRKDADDKVTRGKLLDFADAEVDLVTEVAAGTHTTLKRLSDIFEPNTPTVEASGDTITFSVPKSKHKYLRKISKTTKVWVETSYTQPDNTHLRDLLGGDGYTEELCTIPDDGVITDSKDSKTYSKDSKTYFVDLEKVKFDINDSLIRIECSFKDLSNISSLKYFHIGIRFDMNGNSQNSVGDLALDLGYYRKDADDKTTGKWLELAEASFRRVTEIGEKSFNSIEFIDKFKKIGILGGTVETSGNAIIFSVLKSQHEDLKKISKSTKVRIVAYHKTTTSSSSDYLPDPQKK